MISYYDITPMTTTENYAPGYAQGTPMRPPITVISYMILYMIYDITVMSYMTSHFEYDILPVLPLKPGSGSGRRNC
jgi:hypothetical protein